MASPCGKSWSAAGQPEDAWAFLVPDDMLALLQYCTASGAELAYYTAQSVLGRSGINRMMRREVKRRGYGWEKGSK